MDKNHWITINGLQTIGGQSDCSKLQLPCSYTKTQTGCYFAFYEEYNEASGLYDIKTSLKAEGGRIIITRRGGRNSRMVIEEGKSHSFHYDTGFGSLFLEVCTQKLEACFHEAGGAAHIVYTLHNEGGLLSTNEVEIIVRKDDISNV